MNRVRPDLKDQRVKDNSFNTTDQFFRSNLTPEETIFWNAVCSKFATEFPAEKITSDFFGNLIIIPANTKLCVTASQLDHTNVPLGRQSEIR